MPLLLLEKQVLENLLLLLECLEIN